MKPICIITEPDWLPEGIEDKLAQVFDLKIGPFSSQELAVIAPKATGYLVGLDHILERELLPPNIRFVVSPTTGLNHIDLDHAGEHSISIISLKGETEFLEQITATAELSWGLVLSLLRRIPHAHNSVLAGSWDRDHFKSHELQGATLGIIGLGRLGRKMAHYGKAFEMRVLATDIRDVHVEGVEICDLDTLLSQADIVSLHTDSSPENRHMINADRLSLMKDNALFINTARGDLVDEAALLEALKSGKLAGAALDVLQQEYENGESGAALISWAKAHENLIITPHIGGVTYESQYKTTHFVVDKLLEWWDSSA